MSLNDQSLMPFGAYKDTHIEDVPASYLLYLWEDCRIYNRKACFGTSLDVHNYIKENLTALEKECPDKIVTHR